MTAIPTVQIPSQSSNKHRLTRRRFLQWSAAAAGGLAFYSGEIERHEIDVTYNTIRIAGLPEPFIGYRIVQLSDIHLEEFTEAAFLKKVVDRMNGLHADMIALTGDFVSYAPLPMRFALRWSYHCAEILAGLSCKLRYAVLGNHDVMVSPAGVTDALTSHGIPVLTNRYVPIERENHRIWLAGVADPLEQKPDLSLALPQRRDTTREPVILMAHEPDYADRVLGQQVSLILSGHTHGGQIRIPLLPPLHLPDMGKKYLKGLFHFRDGTQLYVSRGIGTVGLPFRFLCPPELTVITLAAG